MAKKSSARRNKLEQSWSDLLSTTPVPLMLVDSHRRIAFANQSLSEWVGIPLRQLVGSLVEYHSEPFLGDGDDRSGSVVTELCPPPAALAGHRARGTLSCLGRDERLRHRRCEFLPLLSSPDGDGRFAVLAVLEPRDLTPEEVAGAITNPPDADLLHRQLRNLRRSAAQQYNLASLVGESIAMRKVRAQVTAAARCRANVLISGRPGSGRSHVAKAIHFTAATDAATPLVTLDCRLLTEDQLRRGLDSLRRGEGTSLPTLLLLEIGSLPAEVQNSLADILWQRQRECQMIATIAVDAIQPTLDANLNALFATISIELPPLRSRLDDLPLLAQLFLEQTNANGERQVGSVSQAALEMLALYHWPGEIDELRSVIAEAHANCRSHELSALDLPIKMRHAAEAALNAPLPPEMIALDEFMAGIERELVLRALEQASGNKALAARLLGMTRPRLYRRLVQLGLLDGADESESEPEEVQVDDGDARD